MQVRFLQGTVFKDGSNKQKMLHDYFRFLCFKRLDDLKMKYLGGHIFKGCLRNKREVGQRIVVGRTPNYALTA